MLHEPEPRLPVAIAGQTVRSHVAVDARPRDTGGKVPAHRVLPAATAAHQQPSLRTVDGLRGQPRGAALRLRVDEGVAGSAGRAARSPPVARAGCLDRLLKSGVRGATRLCRGRSERWVWGVISGRPI